MELPPKDIIPILVTPRDMTEDETEIRQSYLSTDKEPEAIVNEFDMFLVFQRD